MKRNCGILLAAVAAMLLQACLGSGGNSAPAPTNVAVIALDSRATVSWDMLPGVEYWLFKAAGTGVTPHNCSTMYLCSTLVKVTSPATVWGLYNGVDYSFTINARTSGGPGGPGSPAVQAMPRLAGAIWSTGTSPTASDLHAVTYGAMHVAVGTGGASFSSADGKSWTPLTNPSGANFNAVNYDASHAKYLSVGAGGAVIGLTPGVSSVLWATLSSNTTQDLNAIANTGAGYSVVAGANGTILTSSDGSTWTVQTSGTTNMLNGVTYGYDSTNARYIFVAVGASGTVIYSKDGVNWTTASSGTATYDLKSVTYGLAAGVFVAVGTGGTVLTSTDGITWTLRTSISSTATLNFVTYSTGRRFIAVAEDGNIYYNEYLNAGVDWTPVSPQVTTTPLYAVAPGALYDYSAVGASGLNLYAD